MHEFTTASLLGWAVLAALGAGLGALIGGRRSTVADQVLGWSNASAAGMMLGIGYAILTVGLAVAPAAALFGAGIGVIVMRLLDVHPRAAHAAGDATTRPPGRRRWRARCTRRPKAWRSARRRRSPCRSASFSC